MYLYFDNKGVLKEIVNDKTIRQGDATTTAIVDGEVVDVASDVNNIYFFIEGADPQTVDNVYQALSFNSGRRTFYDNEGNVLGVQDEAFSIQTVTKQIPYDKKRELKYFQYWTDYKMFRIIVPSDITNVSETVCLKISMINNDLSKFTLGVVVFNIEYTGGKAIIWEDTAINIAQWNYLISHVLMKEDVDVGFLGQLVNRISGCIDLHSWHDQLSSVTVKEFYDAGFVDGKEYIGIIGGGVYYLMSVLSLSSTHVSVRFEAIGSYSSVGDYGECSFTGYVTYDNTTTFGHLLYISTKYSCLKIVDAIATDYIDTLFSSQTQIVFRYNNQLYTANLNSVTGVVGYSVEMESLCDSRRWSATLENAHIMLFQFMIDANQADYALENNVVSNYSVKPLDWDTTPTENSTKPVTSGGVKNAIDVALSSVYKVMGSATVTALNDLTKSASLNGNVYNITGPNGTLTNATSSTSVRSGDNVVFIWNDGTWYWDNLGAIVDLSNYPTLDGNNTFTGANAFTTGITLNNNSTQASVQNSGNGQLDFYVSGTLLYKMTAIAFRPIGNSSYDLGTGSYAWRDLYLARNLTDGTNSYTVAESMAQFNVYDTGTDVIKWTKFYKFNLSSNTTFSLETAKSGCSPEYKAIIANTANSAITVTFDFASQILCNDDNIIVTNGNPGTLVLPAGVSIEVSIIGERIVAINFEAQ